MDTFYQTATIWVHLITLTVIPNITPVILAMIIEMEISIAVSDYKNKMQIYFGIAIILALALILTVYVCPQYLRFLILVIIGMNLANLIRENIFK